MLQCPGRLKLTEQNIIFKNSRTGKVEQVQSSDIDLANWQKFVDSWGIRLFLKNGSLHRFCGFKESVSIFCSASFFNFFDVFTCYLITSNLVILDNESINSDFFMVTYFVHFWLLI